IVNDPFYLFEPEDRVQEWREEKQKAFKKYAVK
ncbi:unnamed protein product, partial [marine sediment metagenome]